jgi:hypothetical protein
LDEGRRREGEAAPEIVLRGDVEAADYFITSEA